MSKKKKEDKKAIALKQLNEFYDKLPETKGCMENINKPKEEGGCGGWCCLHPDVRVLTPFGLIPIKDIREGDAVYTKSGVKRVVRTGSRKTKKKIVKVTTCYNRSIILTEDHLVLTDSFSRKSREKANEPKWVEASVLIPKRTNKKGSYIIFPKVKYEGLPGQFLEQDILTQIYRNIGEFDANPGLRIDLFADCHVEDDVVYASKAKRGNAIPRNIEINYELFWMIGLYIAEGSISRSSVDFHIHAKEGHILSRIENFASSLGVYCSNKINRGDSMTVRVFSRVLSSLFSAICGKKCDHKFLVGELYALACFRTDIRDGLIDGYYAGDGTKELPDNREFSASTTSKEWMYQLSHLMLLQGKMSAICHTFPKNKKEVWTISMSDGKYNDYVETDNDFRVPVKSVETVDYDGLVYDIEVDGEVSFTTECGEVHNCKFQNPQVLSIEWKNTWSHVLKEWSIDEIIDVVEKAVRNYLTDVPTKGCIFWNEDTKMCKVHETRPYNCRIYGITPEEEFKPRYERLKKMYEGNILAVVRDQCDLVSTESGDPVTIEQSTRWWTEAVSAERASGTPMGRINDEPGGLYLTYHDHLLLQIMSNSIMGELQALRQGGEREQKEIYIRTMINGLRKKLAGVQ